MLASILYTSPLPRKSISKPDIHTAERDLYSGLIRLHVLHHAAEEPVFGQQMMEELARHGYRLSAGTMYPLLHSLERKGLLRSIEERSAGRDRRIYRATPLGKRALRMAKTKVQELFGELFAHD